MQQRGNSRLNVHRDDEMKHELQGMLRGDHPTRAEEWNDPEPGADDDPALAEGPVPPRGSAGVQEAEDEAFRFELARHLPRTLFPAKRRTLLRALFATRAPDGLVETVRELPINRSFANVQEVAAALGRRPRA
ncbi:DUF2795 domain-containing protein [Streptomyces hoynatensis]|uniref:DUF2795 domain-containing protein n=1 Tax=Streptomyces hoynatensis TaxID=1141874 RepID=A0A3A9Z1T3_9ACTN|nr:DUF2795 domain-containing protein [Streptomyces hoynatensis]RKN42218.1 DUF2795 domain-containing protein [Streptomyces hoynatensis]